MQLSLTISIYGMNGLTAGQHIYIPMTACLCEADCSGHSTYVIRIKLTPYHQHRSKVKDWSWTEKELFLYLTKFTKIPPTSFHHWGRRKGKEKLLTKPKQFVHQQYFSNKQCLSQHASFDALWAFQMRKWKINASREWLIIICYINSLKCLGECLKSSWT